MHKCLRDNRKQLSETCRKEELLLEEKEATSIELNQGLVKTCKAERQLFCSEVQPGSARVFRCLAENMNDADFGANCKYQIIYKLQRRQVSITPLLIPPPPSPPLSGPPPPSLSPSPS